MKNLKIILWAIITAFVILVFFQNQELFLAKQKINLNLYFAGEYPSELPFIVWLLITLVIGLLVSYFFGLSVRFKLKRNIKALNGKIDAQADIITQIRSELETRTGLSDEEIPAAPVDAVKTVPESSDVQPSSDD